MNRQWKRVVLLTIVVTNLFLISPKLHALDLSRALDEFVQRPDPAFAYQLIAQIPGPGFTAHLIRMTSQNWRSSSEVTPTLWNHWLTVIVPDNLQTTTGHLLIEGGGDVGGGPPTQEDIAGVAPIAISTNAVLTVVQQVPMEPLQFMDEPAPLRGDALLAYSWDKVMLTGDPTWTSLFPMTKASVRAMDVAQSYMQQSSGWEISDFILTGASKRGAAVWLTAAVDERVRAIAPLVYPLLRLEKQLERHYESYGFYSEALDDFEARDIFSRLRSPEGALLASVIDPLRYRDRLQMPKFLLNGSGDEYFLPDSTQRFIDKLPGENLQRVIPNANHHLDGHESELFTGLIAWYQSVLFSQPRPAVEWRWNQVTNTLEVSTSRIPLQASLWQATNPTSRDFRVATIGPTAWTATALTPDADGIYRTRITEPPSGFTAFQVELTYPGLGGFPQVYSTSVYVTPERYPFELIDPIAAPKNAAYWRRQVRAAQAGMPDDYTVEQLQDLLPVRLFGEYLRHVVDLERIFEGEQDPARQARTNCLAARLNVEADEIGWYSNVTTWPIGTNKFWRVYRWAESAFERERIYKAAWLCHALNRQ